MLCRLFLIFFLFLAVNTEAIEQNHLPNIYEILESFPISEANIDKYKSSAIEEFEASYCALIQLPHKERNFDQIILGWSQMLERIFLRKMKLVFLSMITSDQSTIDKALYVVKEFDKKITEVLQEKKALEMILSYAEQTLNSPSKENLKPPQFYLIRQIIQSVLEKWPDNKKASSLYKLLSVKTTEKFTYEKGLSPETSLPDNNTLTILNWNVCFFDENFSMLMGGILPWKGRLKRIADSIKKSNADVVCLQELFSREGAQLLFEHLKHTYAHFYINIGPLVYGFNEESFGIPSGLFFASKYPIRNPVFQPYNSQECPKIRAYGFFTAEIMDQEMPITRVITTHLQPNSTEEDLRYRHAEIRAILNKNYGSIPTFLCGDLNIEKDSSEYNKEIRPHFIDFYNGSDWTCCELKDFWWKADQDPIRFQKLGFALETIDYFLKLKSSSDIPIEITTKILPVTFLEYPQDSLSDHQMMISYLRY